MTPVPSSTTIGGSRVHLFQLVRQWRGGDFYQEYIVVGLGDDRVTLDDTDFDGERATVTENEWVRYGYEPVYHEIRPDPFEPVERIPVWGY